MYNQPDRRKFYSRIILKKLLQQIQFNQNQKRKNIIKVTFDNTESYNQPFILAKLQNSISKSYNSTSGPDETYYTLLKELSTISLKYLPNIYNNIWISGNIPTLWKQAKTISSLKKQKNPTNPTSYRTISLTSCSC